MSELSGGSKQSSAQPCVHAPKDFVMHHVDTVERAFQLAGSGKFESIKQIQQQLSREGYNPSLIAGTTLVGQLNKLINARDDCWNAYLQAKERPAAREATSVRTRRTDAARLRVISSR